jgi:cysteinyl-tRNA synthetase
MDDDFNTPQAVAAFFDLAGEIDRNFERGFDVTKAQDTLRELAGVLGLTLRKDVIIAVPTVEVWGEAMVPEVQIGVEEPEAIPFIELLVSVRDKLRAEGNWALADDIRSRLGEVGVILEDTAKGTVWRYRRR